MRKKFPGILDVMRAPSASSLAHQLAFALVSLAAREVLARDLRGFEAPHQAHASRRPTGTEVLRLVASAAVVQALGYWALRRLWSVAWWLATGRGVGGKLLTATAVTPRPYTFPSTPAGLPAQAGMRRSSG
jgi:hypothetical protein